MLLNEKVFKIKDIWIDIFILVVVVVAIYVSKWFNINLIIYINITNNKI